MGLFGNQFANVVEWEEYRDDILFWKWSNQEIKKGSRLIIRPGQDAIFLYNGKVEGISIVQENCILSRTDNQTAAFLDFPVTPLPEQHIISVFFPLYHVGKLISK